MIEKYSYYEFEVYFDELEPAHWLYRIYDPNYRPSKNDILRESDEWFDSQGEARLAAIGHIDLLENGEG